MSTTDPIHETDATNRRGARRPHDNRPPAHPSWPGAPIPTSPPPGPVRRRPGTRPDPAATDALLARPARPVGSPTSPVGSPVPEAPAHGRTDSSHDGEHRTVDAPPPAPALAPLLVVRWADPVVDRLGIDPRSAYVERFWLSLLGPTSVFVMRRFAHEFDSHPDGFSLDTEDCARSIGIGIRGGSKGPFHRSLDRCARFGLLRFDDHGVLAVRTRLPALSRNQVARLPWALRPLHEEWQREQADRVADHAAATHAARLARSLLDVGATPADVLEQLGRWRFDDDTARTALRAAVSR